jgi:2-oxoglutarate dehydrogenase E2 component (dihydrolipoamide succinyltransferase)
VTTTTDVVVPVNAEGTRATVLRWCKRIGEVVAKDEPLVELETDKVTVEVASPATGTLVEILKNIDVEVAQNEVLARLRIDDAVADGRVDGVRQAEVSGTKTGVEVRKPAAAADETGGPRGRDARGNLSPSVRRLLKENGLSTGDVGGTGRHGRITAQDVMRRAMALSSSAAGEPQTNGAGVQGEASVPAASIAAGSRVPHTAMRRRVAEHMVRSLSESPHVTTLFEADLSRVLAHRAQHAAEFERRGARLTLTAYFVSACGRALRMHPEVNATFTADALELHRQVNIGVGTALGNKGLIVPVIHDVPAMDLFGIAQHLGRSVEAARAGKLSPSDVRGGTFTISNHGVGGSLLAAPIVINQPQVAILGVGKVERRVCVLNSDGAESIGIRSMCYLTLSIDHRALDAFQANAFLSDVVETLQEWPLDKTS